MNIYNSHYYWENALISKKELYQKSLKDEASAKNTFFINTVMMNYPREFLENNWGGYTDIKALLGFIQYIYIPAAYHFILNTDNVEVFIPIGSSDEFVEYISESKSEYQEFMISSIQELQSYWHLSDVNCIEQLKDFCKRFNLFWNRDKDMLYIDIFLSPIEIANKIIKNEEFIEVLEEDIGLHIHELLSICEDFKSNIFIRKTFIEFLNNRIGCIV
jgi:hypothetical protein